MNVDVAVIPCAGAGTRMRPATRALPKPLLPVVDRPVIQYVVEEAVAASISEIILVVDKRPGDPVMAHFVEPPALDGLEEVVFTRVLQPEPRGLGDAVLRASEAVGDRPFLCMLSDMFPRPGRSYARRLVEAFDGRTVLAVQPVPDEYLLRWGFVATGGDPHDGIVEVTGAVEKPGPDAPSNLGLTGRYVLTAEIFELLASQDPGHGGEIQLTDAIDAVARARGATGLIVGDDLFDTGIPAGVLEATAAVGLARPDLASGFREVLSRMLDEPGG
ncbi:MAG: sugar phosphate nucleotidyltransferase [Acidimicrobiia bacterium]